MSDKVFSGFQSLFDGNSEYNQMAFVFRSLMAETCTATLVLIKAVHNNGEVAPVGLVDVQPMVAQVDGKGNATPHGIIHNVPYLRVQGGANALIMDPAVGDIGLAVFASRDISSVKANKAPSNPGSPRMFSWSDGLYVGGFLNGAPTNYVRFDSDGNVIIKPATKVTVQGDLDVTGDVTASGVSLKTHRHSGVSTGGGNSGPPV